MELQYISKAVDQLCAIGLAKRKTLRGCSDTEIRDLQISLGQPLPAAYREFLSTMGWNAGGLFRGSDAFLGDLRCIQTYIHSALAEVPTGFQVPRDAIVILSHQGYVYFYLRTSEGDDPPVYRYIQGEQEAICVNDRYSDYLFESVEAEGFMRDATEQYRREHGLTGRRRTGHN